MSSKLIIRSCGSSIRTLLHRHLRLTVTATSIQTQTPGSIYSWPYLLPNSIVPQTLHFAHGIANDAVGGYSVLKEAARGRQKESFDEKSVAEDEDDDDIEMDHSEFDSDDSEFDSDDDSEIYDDDSGHWR